MSERIFVVWRKFQRRTESLGKELDIERLYLHYAWEERNRVLKAVSYVPKFFGTLAGLVRARPRYIFLQLAPTPLMYAAALYCAFTRARYIADCHNTMIYDSHWIKWPLALRLLHRAALVIVHNDDVLAKARALGLDPIVLRDPLPRLSAEAGALPVEHEQPYVIMPCGMAEDEPFLELFAAARQLPDVSIYMTWFADRLPPDIRAQTPPNIRFTGYLEEGAFNALYAGAAAALILTTREGTQPSGAAEAISLGVPMVLSDLATTSHLYGDAAVLIANEGASIAAGIEQAMAEPDKYRQRMASLKERFDREIAEQLDRVRAELA